MVRRSPFFLCLLAFFCVSIPLASCDRVVKRARDRTSASRPEEEENESRSRTSTVNLIAAGDIFPSPSLIQGGIRADGTRDYTPYYRLMLGYERREIDYLTAEDYAKMKTAWEDTVAHLDNAEIGFVHEE